MGYDVKDKALVVNQSEAEAIRTIFDEYLAVSPVRLLAVRLDELGVVSKPRIDRHGRTTGGKALSRGALYNILRNRIYIGKVQHKDVLHGGLHEAITDVETWQRVQTQLAAHGGKPIEAARRPAKRWLDGVLFDTRGRPMRTTHASKSVRQDGTTRTRRYLYYTSKPSGTADEAKIERLPAKEIERLVLGSLKDRLDDKIWLMDQIAGAAVADAPVTAIISAADELQKALASADAETTSQNLNRIIERIDMRQDRLRVRTNLHIVLNVDADCDPIRGTYDTPFQKRQNGRAKPILIAPKDAPQPDRDLIAIVADARKWADELLDGCAASIRQIINREGLRSGPVSRILPLAWLAPDISTAILEGRQPAQSLPDLCPNRVNQRAKVKPQLAPQPTTY